MGLCMATAKGHHPPALVFIDVDGVLNTVKTRRLGDQGTDPLWDQPDVKLMDNFAHIVMACEADVIGHQNLCHALIVLPNAR